MYNRYIPQSDGSYRKNRIPEQSPPAAPPSPEIPQPLPHPPPPGNSAGGFLKNLLPKDLDTGDLLIILIILLMAEQNQQERNTALLTLALYFFM